MLRLQAQQAYAALHPHCSHPQLTHPDPRWASWNLGVFICIRCSGIHRGMGTHISKVKSVDLDTWTDEQLQSVLRWGNARANKYWEAKLAPGHVPSEAKIENFIRTKYESKRWVMDGPMPSPEELGEDDDDMPLKKVQEKVQIERSASQRLSGPSSQPRPQPPPQQQQPAIDLFGDAPPRASSGPPVSRPAPKAEAAPPKQTKAGDSLLGLDFLGGSSAQPSRPSSTGPASAAPSRPDLKQSILSLYASAPKPAAQQAPQQHARQDSFGGLSSPTHGSQKSPAQSSFGGMNDAFSNLSFTQPAAKPNPAPSPFSGLDLFSAKKSPPASDMFGGGGNFFDSKPKSPPVQNRTTSPPMDLSGFGGFSSMTSTSRCHRTRPRPRPPPPRPPHSTSRSPPLSPRPPPHPSTTPASPTWTPGAVMMSGAPTQLRLRPRPRPHPRLLRLRPCLRRTRPRAPVGVHRLEVMMISVAGAALRPSRRQRRSRLSLRAGLAGTTICFRMCGSEVWGVRAR
jgi:stromal membrane-associated protein